MSNRTDVTKSIMPNRCDLCSIGIGTSMLYFENTWRPFKHIETRPYNYQWFGTKLKVCEDCFKELKNMKNVNAYLKRQFDKRKLKHE